MSGLRYDAIVCGLFFVLALSYYIKAVPQDDVAAGKPFLIACAFAVASAACHSSGLAVFPLLILYDLFVARASLIFPAPQSASKAADDAVAVVEHKSNRASMKAAMLGKRVPTATTTAPASTTVVKDATPAGDSSVEAKEKK